MSHCGIVTTPIMESNLINMLPLSLHLHAHYVFWNQHPIA